AAYEDLGGCRWYRFGCDDDWTNVIAAPDDGWNPLTMPVDTRLGKGNRLVNGDFGFGAQFIGPWQRFDETTTPWHIVEEAGEGALAFNHRLTLGRGSGDASIYQDVPIQAMSGKTFGFGARLWANQPGLSATLTVWELGNGSVQHSLGTFAVPLDRT